MLKQTINGFVMDKPILNGQTFVFASSINSLPINAVSLESLVTVVKDDTEVIFFTKGFEDLDYNRIENIASKNDKVKLSIFSLDNRKELPYIVFSMLSLDSDIIYFIPFMLKRYVEAYFVRPGTIFREFPIFDSVSEVCKCISDLQNYETLYLYNIPKYVETVTLKKIRDTLMETNEVENRKILNEISLDYNEESADYTVFGRRQDGYTKEFLSEAKKTIFYEKIKFDLNKRRQERKDVIDSRSLVHLFPFEKIPKGARIVIYGYGDVGRQFSAQMRVSGFCKVVGIVDKNAKLLQRRGYDIQSIEKIVDMDYEYIIIANASKTIQKEIKNGLESMGVSNDKIISVVEREYQIDNGRIGK